MKVEIGRSRGRSAMAEINVTPLVDVMLVMLIVFMVTAPLIQQGIEVRLPKTQSQGLTSDEERLVVTVKKDGKIFVQLAEVELKGLETKVGAIFASRDNREIFLRADENVAYGTVAKVLACLRRAGADRIGMVTEPEV